MKDTPIDPQAVQPDAIDPDSSVSGDSPSNRPADPHPDKFNDPRVAITGRGIALGIGVVVLGIIGAATSIYARRTRLEQTTRFWGEETITALQLGERMHLLPLGHEEFEPVELTATPGLGHLRHALLDERSFDWTTETTGGAAEMCGQADDSSPCVRIRLTDPTAHRFDTVEIDLDLAGGWIGPSDGSRRVRATERAQPKLRNYFKTIINVEQLRYDLRD